MASPEGLETSLFSLNGARERMRERKNGALRAAKLNASLASKIKTKIINNSSTIKVSLKRNNKALALALNAEKANAQRLTQEKTVLQKEVEQCHFHNAALRHKLFFLNNTLKEMEKLMAAIKTARLSEFCTSSASLSNGQKSSITEDSWADDTTDSRLVRPAVMLLKAPVSKLCDGGKQDSSSTAVQTSPVDLQRPVPDKPREIVPIVSKVSLETPQLAEKPQSSQEESVKKPCEAAETEEAFVDCHVFGESLCATQQNPNGLPALTWESHPLPYEEDEMVKRFCDRLSQGCVTQRRKRSTLFATSTPSSGVDFFSNISSTRVSQWSITKDSSSSNKSNTQLQLKSPSSLASPAQTAADSDIKSSGKEVLCDQPQAEETVCDAGIDPNCSQVPELVPVKVKGKGNCKTSEKTSVKKASTRKKKRNSIKSDAKGGSDAPQGEENAQNVKKLLQPSVAANSSGPEVPEMNQEACVAALEGMNRGCGANLRSHLPDEVRDLRRTYVVNPAQLQNLESGDLLQQVKKEAVFEIQSVESLLKSPVHAFSSHKAPSDDSGLQYSLSLRKETSGVCALQQDSSSVSTKSIRRKTSRKTRVIMQRNHSDEENVPNSVKISEAKAEEQPKRSQSSRRKTVRESSCNDQRNEVEVSGPCIGAEGVAKESAKDLPDNPKRSRKTYVVRPLDLTGNLGCIKTDFDGDEIVPSRCVPGSKASKIPRVQRMVTAQSNKKWTGDLQEKGQAEVHNNMNAFRKEAYPKPKPLRKENTCSPSETDSLARQSDGAGLLPGSSAELVSGQIVLMGKLSCFTDLRSEPDTFLEEQIAEISLTNNLMSISDSLESSVVTCSAALPHDSRLTDLPGSKSLGTEGNKIPEKSSVWAESTLIFKERSVEEVPEGRNQVELSAEEHFQSSALQEPEIRPLQDLTNARTLSSPSSEGASGRPSRRRRDPACYAEPKLNSKLRRGDPFTNTEFLHSPVYKTKKKKMTKPKAKTKKIKEEKEWLPE